ncbi:MarR family winged helix-turn-helix transcriptional regulator [Diaphorobacter aerolatus]|uniref:Winged helix-turn-helix transcriptional regulator n=1 Tax=Diaphorobacter aerolatus TaxID=1288495 RepID=A0A7H0GG08_9BURK|nr:MarR family winged helix-turn-helix transcriptional regulator [Diaphorobacter aerolatus]QNP47224.1 winged helix-turn-helix transcriptional regulator [Diaphorobacter aerolatus]
MPNAPLSDAAPLPSSSLTDPQQPSQLFLYRLSKLHASAGRLITRLCERDYGITRREWGMLMWLMREPGIGPSDLAERLELDRSRISRAVATMMDKGLVQRTNRETNRREAQLQLTPQGQRLHDDIWPRVRAINVGLLEPLNADSVAALNQALSTLLDQVAQMESAEQVTERAYPSRRAGSRRSARSRDSEAPPGTEKDGG